MNETDEITTRLRQALHAEAARVEPSLDALDAIRSRTAPSPRQAPARRPWVLGVATAGLAAAATILGVSILANPDPATSPPGISEQPTPSEQPKTARVTVYYLGEAEGGSRLFQEIRRVLASEDKAVAAVRTVLRSDPTDPDYYTPWVGDVTSVRHKGGVITVNLTGAGVYPGTDVATGAVEAAVQQLVYTVQAALRSKDPVVINNKGDGDGLIPTGEPIARTDPLSVLAMVQITSPGEGAVVDSPVVVRGMANVFEANVNWDVRQDGRVVKSGFTTTGGAFEFSPFEQKIALPPGDYELRFYERSAEDGRITHMDTKTITVR